MTKTILLYLALIAACLVQPTAAPAAGSPADAQFNALSEEYISGYLKWRPLAGTSLGFHQYDGKITDFSQASLEIELARLKTFDRRLEELDRSTLSPQAYYDLRILQNAIKREIFNFEATRIYWRNPMTYSSSMDVNTYIKRNFAPLEDRAKSIVAILKQAPRIFAAARENLEESLARPLIETSIQEATGNADFLKKDLVDALKDVKNQTLMTEFIAVNNAAIQELQDYATFLKEKKLPKANESYALGREKYAQLLNYGEMITKSPEQLLEMGMRELAAKQKVFADAGKQIDATKKPIDVFKAIQKDHPTAQNLISDTAKDLEAIRQFVVNRHILTLPSPVRAAVKETPQFLRATSFASMDTPGPFETKATEAYYYITPVEPDWPAQQKEEWLTAFNYYTTDIVSVHEAYPGHYAQYLCLNASPATKLEKIFVSYAFSEGWAHYAEQMMVDEGFGSSFSQPKPNFDELVKAAKYRMAQTDEALLRLCRLCVSIKMHTQGMTVDEGTSGIL